jgi:hypothetical protein
MHLNSVLFIWQVGGNEKYHTQKSHSNHTHIKFQQNKAGSKTTKTPEKSGVLKK